MVLSDDVWAELIQVGLLDGQETCALCRERPSVLVDVAKAPILLCARHAQATANQLAADLLHLADPASSTPGAPANPTRA
jgi:hypothetical protein